MRKMGSFNGSKLQLSASFPFLSHSRCQQVCRKDSLSHYSLVPLSLSLSLGGRCWRRSWSTTTSFSVAMVMLFSLANSIHWNENHWVTANTKWPSLSHSRSFSLSLSFSLVLSLVFSDANCLLMTVASVRWGGLGCWAYPHQHREN